MFPNWCLGTRNKSSVWEKEAKLELIYVPKLVGLCENYKYVLLSWSLVTREVE
ncbi:hypothetical protein ACFLSQ_04060 [Bacteroidota bacterium]